MVRPLCPGGRKIVHRSLRWCVCLGLGCVSLKSEGKVTRGATVKQGHMLWWGKCLSTVKVSERGDYLQRPVDALGFGWSLA